MNTFIKLPWKIYKGDPYWVPPLIIDQKKILNKNKGTFFQFGEAELFIAYDGKEPVGRVSAHIDHQYEEYRDKRTGQFGFLKA